jgi:hypothetical protein
MPTARIAPKAKPAVVFFKAGCMTSLPCCSLMRRH